MVCATVAEKSVGDMRQALAGLSFAEVRMDAAKMTARDAATLFSGNSRLIATCRPGGFNHDCRMDLLLAAIEAGASYVDVEIEAESAFQGTVMANAREKGCKVIVSYHNYVETPARDELEAVADQCFALGADIAKIACLARSKEDNARLMGLLGTGRPIVALGMGAMGSITRIMAPLLGSPFTYGALEEGREVVEGQLDYRVILGHLASLGRVAGVEVTP